MFFITRLQDITIDQFREIRQKAGGLVILLPQHVSDMTFEEKEVMRMHVFIINIC